jgi:hypothetical protein
MMSRISADLLIQLRHEEEVSSVEGKNSVAHCSFFYDNVAFVRVVPWQLIPEL